MATNRNLPVTDLDFDTIKENLKAFLRSQEQFKDFDFEGSGMSILLDVLAYNTHYHSFYINMVANEMFLDSAVTRDAIVSLSSLRLIPTPVIQTNSFHQIPSFKPQLTV